MLLDLSKNLMMQYSSFTDLIKVVSNIRDLNDIRAKFLGKKGTVSNAIRDITLISQNKRQELGINLNKVRNAIKKKIVEVGSHVDINIINKKLKSESIDITLPGRNYTRGKMHPISHIIDDIKDILYYMGLQHVDGPSIESEWNNFTALNISRNHPSRQMHDTFYVKGYSNTELIQQHVKLLRTHTSTVQIRYMSNNQPPFKIFSVGKVYRSDYDATHTPVFHQLECLVVDKASSIMRMQVYLKTFLSLLFDLEYVPMRFRSSYFPFTEPSFELDIKYNRNTKEETPLDRRDHWLEILGCGVVNQKVFRNVNIDPIKYQGFAFGAGIERLAMIKYNIQDLRHFFEGDIRWLNYYGF